MSNTHNYYAELYRIQTARVARVEGLVLDRAYGYVVRIIPPRPFGGRQFYGSQVIDAWCKTKAVALRKVEDNIRAQKEGWHSCPCGSDKQARNCCGIPPIRFAGCGRMTFVCGTNGGRMPCGSMLTGLDGKTAPYYCCPCQELIIQRMATAEAR